MEGGKVAEKYDVLAFSCRRGRRTFEWKIYCVSQLWKIGGRENRLSNVETEGEKPRGDKSKNKKTVLVFQKTHYTSITKCRMLMETVIF